ncbi:S-adenosyl-L-methionine-dependent methyltransferase [Lophiotrema nucula]|uniref:S-adenosyl-L-methionine-dependent methyltransferase n=1 Tax=Lophiotrema nucula TaxID=690887 RepID=A0A6A5YVC6_9PLEO|nr:S-adenosyl-L-methionine-dependent methyltransferase [Lophiotrema nucula]
MATEAEYRPFRQDMDAAARYLSIHPPLPRHLTTKFFTNMLYLQHWMRYTEVGFLIHPSVHLPTPGLKVADVACGTGIWLIELAKQVPKDAQLEGFYISSAHFPPKDELPENVKLGYMDMMQSVPENLLAQYDIVHVRGVVLYVFNDDPSELLANFMVLLKPGGYLCWDDLDLAAHNPKTSDPNVSHEIADKIEEFGRMWFKTQGLPFSWLRSLDTTLTSHGLEALVPHSQTVSNAGARPWTLMQPMANRHFFENDINTMCEAGKMPPGSPSAEEWREMSEGLIEECREGVRLLMDIVYIVGRKAVEQK